MSQSARIASLIGGAVMASTSAFSADLPRSPVYKAAPAPAQTWTGAYVGGTAGYGWAESSSIISPIDTQFVPFFQSVGSLPTSLNPKLRGFMGGGEVGYNWQSGYWVAGVEADFSYSGLRGDDTFSAGQINANPASATTQSNRLDWFGTVRGRMGVLISPDVLLFGTAGLAYGRVKASTNMAVEDPGFLCPVSVLCSVGSTSETRVGWAIGGGLETRITSRWTAKIEYLHFDLGSISDTAHSLSSIPFWQNQPMVGVTSDITGDIVRIGLNYQL